MTITTFGNNYKDKPKKGKKRKGIVRAAAAAPARSRQKRVDRSSARASYSNFLHMSAYTIVAIALYIFDKLTFFFFFFALLPFPDSLLVYIESENVCAAIYLFTVGGREDSRLLPPRYLFTIFQMNQSLSCPFLSINLDYHSIITFLFRLFLFFFLTCTPKSPV
jgi:hypothetical protein